MRQYLVRRMAGLWVMIACALSICGCGGADKKNAIVTGAVKVDDVSVAGAIVSFSGGGGLYNAYTDSSGRFSMNVSQSSKGIPVGEYLVSVRSVADLIPNNARVDPPGMKSTKVESEAKTIPTRYSDFKKSELVASVASGKTNHFSLDLRSAAQ